MANRKAEDDGSLSEVSYSTSSTSDDTCMGLGNFQIQGKIQLSIWYKEEMETLLVQVDEAEDLAGVTPEGCSNPYIIGYILPEHSEATNMGTRRKTSVKKNTNNPKYGEIFKYELAMREVDEKMLWITVWNYEEDEINLFLGEVCLLLSNLDLTESKHVWYLLKEWNSPVVGQLHMALLLEDYSSKNKEDTDKMYVCIHGAKNLQISDYTQFLVKAVLLPDMSEKQTKVSRSVVDPTWNEVFIFDDVSQEKLSSTHYLEIRLCGVTSASDVEFIGGIRLGPIVEGNYPEGWMDLNKLEANHWRDMLSCNGIMVERCHTLRSSMVYGSDINIELSIYREDMIEDQLVTEMSRRRFLSSLSSLESQHSSLASDEIHIITETPGYLNVSLMIEECGYTNKGIIVKLMVMINDAEGLQCSGKYTSVFAAVNLLPDELEKRTNMVKANPNPDLYDVFIYDNILLEKLHSDHVVDIKLYGVTSSSVEEFLGGLRLGPLPIPGISAEWVNSTATEFGHWHEMLSSQGQWVDHCHKLRLPIQQTTNIDPLAFEDNDIINEKSKDSAPSYMP